MSDSPFFRILIAIVPIMTATLYLAGLTYYEGFVGGYGVDPSLFSLASDTTLLYGFFSLGAIGLQPFNNIILIVLSLLLLIVLTAILSSDARVKAIQTKVVSRLERHMPSKEVSGILDKGSTSYLYIAGTFLLVFLPFFIAVLSYQSGEKYANLNKDNFKNQTGKWVMLHSIGSITPIRGQQIACGKTHCAFWLGSEALILAHDRVEKVTAHVQTE